jgi:hypothetical protein
VEVVRLKRDSGYIFGLGSSKILDSDHNHLQQLSSIMDLNVKAANSILSNPPKDIKNVVTALPSASPVSNVRTSLMNGSNGTTSSAQLQIVDELKNFTCVISYQEDPGR